MRRWCYAKTMDARIRVDGIKGKGIIESAKKLAEKVKCEHGVIVLHFPMVHSTKCY